MTTLWLPPRGVSLLIGPPPLRHTAMSLYAPENGLDPCAIRRWLKATSDQARADGSTVVIATFSPVLLHEFNSTPDRVFVLLPDWPAPRAVTELEDPGWLAHFDLANLYIEEQLWKKAE